MPSWNEAAASLPTWGETAAQPLARSETFSAREKITAWFEEGFAKHGGGLPVTFELIFQMLPDPARPGVWNPMVGIYAEIPAHTLNKSIQMVATGPEGWRPAEISARDAEEIARVIIGRLREGRDNEVRVASEQAQAAAENGQPAPHSGIILP